MAGQPFLPGILPADARLAVELAFGADLAADPGTWTWADVTADAMYAGGGVTISPVGRGDETAKAQPAGCQLRLLNTSGAYSKNLPTSPYWPNVRRNTPVRVSAQSTLSPTLRSVATTTSAAPSFAATAPAGVAAGDVVLAFHTADASFLGDLDKPSGANWRLLAEVGTTATGGGTTVGYLATRVWYYRATGGAPASYTFTQGNVANGVVSIVAVQNAGLYTLDAVTTSETPPAASFDTPSSSPLRADDFELRWAAGSDLAGVVGVTWTPPAGLTERADAQSGNYTTATLATRTVGATTATGVKTFTASSSALDWGHGVTVNFSNVNVRFQGQANGFVPSWDTSANVAVVDVSASGKLRQLQQGKTPLRSPLYRAVAALQPVAHWPMEDGKGATVAGTAITGQADLSVTAGTVAFGEDTHPLGAVASVNVFNGHMGVTIPARTDPNGWAVFVAFRLTRPVVAGSLINLLSWSTVGGITYSFLVEDDGSFTEVTSNNAATTLSAFGSASIHPYDGNWHTMLVMVTKVDATTSHMDLWIDGVHSTDQQSPHVFSPLGGPVIIPDDRVFATTNTDSVRLAGLAFFETTSITPDNLISAVSGWSGETVAARLARLCAEEGVPVAVRVNADAPSPVMGAQGVDTFVNLLRECETTDDGVLYDGRGPGLAYVSRGVRYNAATALTADMAASPPQVALPFAPVDDDQRNRNEVTVTRKGGATSTYEDSSGPLGTAAIGVYDAKVSPDPNYVDDSTNYFRAAWEVHKGTVDAPYRYPRLNLDLGAVPAIVWDWLSAAVSSRIDVTNVAVKATQHPPGDIDLLLEGWAEQLSPFDWTVAGNCSPFEPWRVAVIEGAGDTALRIDSGSSTLAGSVAAGATSISVATTNPVELWSTAAGDYPRAVAVGGVRVNVTAVAGAVSPQTFTVDPLPYPLTAGAAVKLWRPPTIAL